jgi:hypothetical protein
MLIRGSQPGGLVPQEGRQFYDFSMFLDSSYSRAGFKGVATDIFSAWGEMEVKRMGTHDLNHFLWVDPNEFQLFVLQFGIRHRIFGPRLRDLPDNRDPPRFRFSQNFWPNLVHPEHKPISGYIHGRLHLRKRKWVVVLRYWSFSVFVWHWNIPNSLFQCFWMRVVLIRVPLKCFNISQFSQFIQWLSKILYEIWKKW